MKKFVSQATSESNSNPPIHFGKALSLHPDNPSSNETGRCCLSNQHAGEAKEAGGSTLLFG